MSIWDEFDDMSTDDTQNVEESDMSNVIDATDSEAVFEAVAELEIQEACKKRKKEDIEESDDFDLDDFDD